MNGLPHALTAPFGSKILQRFRMRSWHDPVTHSIAQPHSATFDCWADNLCCCRVSRPFLGVEKARTEAIASFGDTISGTDIIVGARSGSVQLLLYSVFRIGNATNNVTWESYQDLAARPEIDWIAPISLGDSHRQFRVMGTTAAYFEHCKYRGGRALDFAKAAHSMMFLMP